MESLLKKIIKEIYNNLKEANNYEELNEYDFENIAENINDSDDFWNMLENYILEELEHYKKEGK